MGKIYTGKVGLEDIAWGEGTLLQVLGNGLTRTITRVNLSNMPFDELKTVGQQLQEFSDLLVSSSYAAVNSKLLDVQEVSAHINMIVDLVNSMANIQAVASNITSMNEVAGNIPNINNVVDAAQEAQQAITNAQYIKNRLSQTQSTIYDYLAWLRAYHIEVIVPFQAKIDAALITIQAAIDNALQQILAGNELAQKFGTYTIEVQVLARCWTPRFIVDDPNHKLIFQLPESRNQCVVVPGQGGSNCVCDEIAQPDVEAAFPDAGPLVVAPSINCVTSVSIAENNAIGAPILQLTGSNGGEPATWGYGAFGSAVTSIDQTGLITAKIVYDYEGVSSYPLNITYTNSVGTATCDIQLHITDVAENQAPVITNCPADSVTTHVHVYDNIPVGTVLFTAEGLYGDTWALTYAEQPTEVDINQNGEVYTLIPLIVRNEGDYQRSCTVTYTNANGTATCSNFNYAVDEYVPVITNCPAGYHQDSILLYDDTAVGTIIHTMTGINGTTWALTEDPNNAFGHEVVIHQNGDIEVVEPLVVIHDYTHYRNLTITYSNENDSTECTWVSYKVYEALTIPVVVDQTFEIVEGNVVGDIIGQIQGTDKGNDYSNNTFYTVDANAHFEISNDGLGNILAKEVYSGTVTYTANFTFTNGAGTSNSAVITVNVVECVDNVVCTDIGDVTAPNGTALAVGSIVTAVDTVYNATDWSLTTFCGAEKFRLTNNDTLVFDEGNGVLRAAVELPVRAEAYQVPTIRYGNCAEVPNVMLIFNVVAGTPYTLNCPVDGTVTISQDPAVGDVLYTFDLGNDTASVERAPLAEGEWDGGVEVTNNQIVVNSTAAASDFTVNVIGTSTTGATSNCSVHIYPE